MPRLTAPNMRVMNTRGWNCFLWVISRSREYEFRPRHPLTIAILKRARHLTYSSTRKRRWTARKSCSAGLIITSAAAVAAKSVVNEVDINDCIIHNNTLHYCA